jgi:hypothetical protein
LAVAGALTPRSGRWDGVLRGGRLGQLVQDHISAFAYEGEKQKSHEEENAQLELIQTRRQALQSSQFE